MKRESVKSIASIACECCGNQRVRLELVGVGVESAEDGWEILIKAFAGFRDENGSTSWVASHPIVRIWCREPLKSMAELLANEGIQANIVLARSTGFERQLNGRRFEVRQRPSGWLFVTQIGSMSPHAAYEAEGCRAMWGPLGADTTNLDRVAHEFLAAGS